ncbi:FAD/FMN-containing protein [Ceratobasidium sp. AG-I]|nr:FAD/FMN-containing protein [Ceratobasidium sp. AG-I]
MKLTSISLCLYLASSGVLATRHCTAFQKCWPSPTTWSSFNASINGRLVAPRPPAWPCHDPHYDEVGCAEAKVNWHDPFWRSDQTGAMQDPIWESPNCDIGSPRNVTCKQGFVPTYSVVAHEAGDVVQAVKFAGKHRLRLVIKNTGHDYLGRSSGAGSLSIWTHKLTGMNFTDSFVAEGCPGKTPGVPAVTIGAAEVWLNVYRAAEEHNVTIVGGGARSVGAAGGWIQGGGHSPLGALYGMGVDNTLQFTVVKPNGKVVIANACQNKDLFWALNGGGGSTWGVTLDVTYKTHPPLTGIVGLGITLNTTSSQKLMELSSVLIRTLPNLTDDGLRGYGYWQAPKTLLLLLVHPNSLDVSATNNTLKPFWDWIAKNEGTQIRSYGTLYPSFFAFFEAWVSDVAIAIPTILSSRLISRKALSIKSDELAQYVLGDQKFIVTEMNIVGGGAVSKADPESTSLNPQWRNDALVSWTFGGSWEDDTPNDQIEAIHKSVTKLTQKLGKIAGLEDAAYFNEADPREPQWKKAFFGPHYDRLLSIKRQVDPKGLFTCNRCVGSDSG